MYCQKCGNKIGEGGQFCDSCGTSVSGNPQFSQPTKKEEDKKVQPVSSTKDGPIPWEIRGWNWGAFGLSWIWGLGNDTYIALLALIPIVNIVMIFVLGARGNEWAWRNGHWDSIEHFKAAQRRWTVAWLILLGIGIAILFFLVILGIMSSSNQQ